MAHIGRQISRQFGAGAKAVPTAVAIAGAVIIVGIVMLPAR